MEIWGEAAPGFEAVRNAFARNLESGSELGGAFAAHVDGRVVVDLWGGVRDRETGKPYDEDTLQLVFSATKGLTALCAHMLVEEGRLDLGEPVARWWPEFARNGKERLPARWLLSHMAGLPTIDRRLSPEEVFAWDPVCEALAAQKPFWEPGTAYGYHALTYGWLVGELFRRAAGETVGRYFARRVAEPLGLDAWIGLPGELAGRVAPVEMGPDMVESPLLDPDSLLVRTGTLNHSLGPIREWINQPTTWSVEVPAGNAICNARSLSRLYAALIGPIDGCKSPILGAAQLARACQTQTEGYDVVFGSGGIQVETRIGLGFFLRSPGFQFGGQHSFGHPGASGALGFADPERGVSCGYVSNTMNPVMGPDPRATALLDAVYDSLAN